MDRVFLRSRNQFRVLMVTREDAEPINRETMGKPETPKGSMKTSEGANVILRTAWNEAVPDARRAVERLAQSCYSKVAVVGKFGKQSPRRESVSFAGHAEPFLQEVNFRRRGAGSES